ncbi:MAG: polyprenyl synthetase family protein [Gemmatimonadaceae bacterium]
MSSPSAGAIGALREDDGFLQHRTEVDGALEVICDRYLPDVSRTVAGAIRYSLLGEGKRLRPILLICAYRAAGGHGDATLLAAAVEVVHAYSLVHDDLPCMDDDDMRRGRPTTHRMYGVGVAAAAGLAMVPMAALAALDGAEALGLPVGACGAIVGELMCASGASGMVGGQLLDLEAEGSPTARGGFTLSVAELERIHRLKTGQLIAASVRIGGMAAGLKGRGPKKAEALDRYGEALGLAFQIADDVLDATSTSDRLGKTAGRDAVLKKSTFPSVLGVTEAIARANALAVEARDALSEADMLTAELERLAQFVVVRRW